MGAIIIGLFFLHIRSMERRKKAPLIATHIFQNRTSNRGLVTQFVQWTVLQGSFFIVSVFFQTIRGFSAIGAGLILTPATIGILLTGVRARKLATRTTQRRLIIIGFVLTTVGMLLVLFLPIAMATAVTASVWTYVPGLFFMGLGFGIMITSSVNVVSIRVPGEGPG